MTLSATCWRMLIGVLEWDLVAESDRLGNGILNFNRGFCFVRSLGT